MIIIEEIKRVKVEYEGTLKDKERVFEQKIKEIKTVIEESERRRKSEREKIAEASREYKRVNIFLCRFLKKCEILMKKESRFLRVKPDIEVKDVDIEIL